MTHYVNIGYHESMFKIHLLVMGSIKETYLDLGIKAYLTRLSPYVDITLQEVMETPVQQLDASSIDKALITDAEKVKKLIPKQTHLVMMDIAGVMMDSPTLASKLSTIQNKVGHLTIVVGGSHGLHESLKKTAKEKWSFSPLTFPHQLFRLMVLEQLYRAMTILANHPYHK